MAPSTFASAAAGSNSSSRADSGGDWARRTNGATQTFRRSSTNVSASSHQRDSSGSQSANPAPNPGVYVPPHLHASRNGVLGDNRYSKVSLLQLFQTQRDAADSDEGIRGLCVSGWDPAGALPNGAAGGTWGRRDEQPRDGQPSADVCWDRQSNSHPLGLSDLTAEEKEVFSTSVNSPLKPPTQTPNKENMTKDGPTMRKASISQAQSPGAFGLSSLNTSRSGTRRWESGEYSAKAGGFSSPVGTSRFTRDESHAATPPPALLRRATDFKDSPANEEGEKEKPRDAPADTGSPFGSLKRSTTTPFSAGLNGPSSPWGAGPQSATFSPMGAFGNFALGSNPGQASTPTEKRPNFGSMRGESRFRGLMNKESAEDVGRGVNEKLSSGSLNRGSEPEPNRPLPSWMEARSNRPLSNDTDPFPDDDMRIGGATIGRQDASSPRHGLGTPRRQDSIDSGGFSAFGMADSAGFRDAMSSRDAYQHQTPQHGPGGGDREPMSPTNTNPYQSPEQDRTESDDAEADSHLPGLGGFGDGAPGMAAFGGPSGLSRIQTGHDIPGSDRSQTSSAGPNRGFAGLSGLGGLPGLGGASAWSAAPAPTAGTPSRDRHGFVAGFGEAAFGSVGDMQSPSLPGLGNNMFSPGSAAFGNAGPIGRGVSKMGSLFPTAMQDQIRSADPSRQPGEGGLGEALERIPQSAGPFGRNAFGPSANTGPARDTESPSRPHRGVFDDYLGSLDTSQRGVRGPDSGFPGGDLGGGLFGQSQSSAAIQSPIPASAGHGNIGQSRGLNSPQISAQAVGSSSSSQPPPNQQKQMVMPDRMRWIYRDPQGNTQGPWSGLEMHDWYRAGFFSADLLVKKFEEAEYEPLAQLIRKIGNSREPFLVPQIGIPHGAPPPPGTGWQAPLSGSAANAQPPFASSFPSFGTTLTAEQQNALERRKQEEQFLMARQKEYLQQQQVMVKQMGPHGMHQGLQHHSSAHSLHSQPSFGSITSPSGYQPSPTQGPTLGGQPVPGFFDNSFRPGPGGPGGMDALRNIREEDIPGMIEQLHLGRGAHGHSGAGGPFSQASDPSLHEQQVAAMLNDRARLEREQAEHDAMQQRFGPNEQHLAQASADRLNQFHDLRTDDSLQAAEDDFSSRIAGQMGEVESDEEEETPSAVGQPPMGGARLPDAYRQTEHLSLTEQVQKAAFAKQPAAPLSPWAKVDAPPILPFPPPQSSSPLPAPAAQRRQNVADTLTVESHPQIDTPSAETPSASLAPWAKETAEAPKGPSLKQIQEAEARKAAQQEELAAAVRRQQMERELMATQHQPPPAPGLPSTSNWASSGSPGAAAPSVWSKALPSKTATTGSSGATSKKTLQQIQKEEEARKQRAVAAASAAASASPAAVAAAVPQQPSSSGKRYADLASKHTPSGAAAPTAPGGGIWTTVGAGGKAKGPSGAVPTGPAAGVRAPNSATVPATAPAGARPRPTVATGGRVASGTVPTMQTGSSGFANAMEEFRKWAIVELRGDLSKGINVDDFVSGLLSFPAEPDVLTEAVHSVSQTIDSRHFADEFIRRRRLADKGVVDTASPSPAAANSAGGGGGGWSEVAKKGAGGQSAGGPGQQGGRDDVGGGNFKVVAAKKKGGKR